jgi:long-chain fatty acid transport protein
MKKLTLTAAIAFSLNSSFVLSSGFQLLEQNASGLGRAFAGSAVAADNASILYYNAAGLSSLTNDNEFTFNVDIIDVNAQFQSIPSQTSSLPTLISTGTGNGGNAGGINYIPATFISYTLNSKWRAGLGINAPFGLKTNYDPDFIGRFLAVKSDIKTLNYNPTLSYKVDDNTAIGFGVNYQKLDATLSNQVNYSGLLATLSAGAIIAPNVEGLAAVKGTSSAWGWNIGILSQLTEDTKIGFSYRSSITHKVDGSVAFNKPTTGNPVVDATLSAGVIDGPINTAIKLPETAILSMSHQLNDQWEILGDLSYTGWSSLKSLDIFRADNTPLSSENLQWNNTYRAALGTNYSYSDKITLKTGIAFDQTPIKSQYRLARLPGTDRRWLSFGINYKLSNESAVDFGYAHLFLNDALINANGGSTAAKGNLVGSYQGDVNIYGVQFTTGF